MAAWIWGVIAWLVVGALAGLFASIFTGTNSRNGIIADIIVGMVGGVLGGFVIPIITETIFVTFDVWSLFVSFIVACMVLGIARILGLNSR